MMAAATTKVKEIILPIINTESVVYGVLPYFHAGGLLTTFCLLALGAHIIVNKKFNVKHFYDVIFNYKVTVLNVVPTILQTILNCDREIDQKLCSLEYIFVGSSKTDPELIDRLKKHYDIDIQLILVYGSTETGAINFMHPVHCRTRLGSCGILMPGNKAKVINLKNGKCCNSLEIGELWLQTPAIKKINNEWYRTGDLAYYDQDGYFYIKGRVKDLIKVRGWQVSPIELEEEILKLAGVKECAVVGVPDEVSGQVPKAYVVINKESKLTKNHINDIIRSKFSSYKQLAGGIEFIDELPKTASGKVSKHLLLEKLSRSN
uniref:AMP-binding domain-containing protein n=1 Tax=Syphacia muris TaxID=451379 RepID=A0A0N5AHV5_9BILA